MTRYIEERRGVFGVEPTCRGARGAGQHSLRAQIPEAVPPRAARPRAAARDRGRPERLPPRLRRAQNLPRAASARRRCAPRQVARVMRQNGIEGRLRGPKKRTTIPDEAAVERACGAAAARLHSLWVPRTPFEALSSELAPCRCLDSSRRRERSTLSAPPFMSFTRARAIIRSRRMWQGWAGPAVARREWDSLRRRTEKGLLRREPRRV
jgi:hypothetical protein